MVDAQLRALTAAQVAQMTFDAVAAERRRLPMVRMVSGWMRYVLIWLSFNPLSAAGTHLAPGAVPPPPRR